MLNTPIAYIIFNRPHHTRMTFEAIRSQQPSKLFIIADGPRELNLTDPERCSEVRSIVEHIDWPCEVYRNYSDQNLGCKERVITGLNWVFSSVDRAIILEDDCLPHNDFFGFCEALLNRYENDERVMVITGDNFQNGRRRGQYAYYFSKHIHIWGWATWRRAWQKNDPKLEFWPKWKESNSWLKNTPDRVEQQFWIEIFDRMYSNEIDTWDYSWAASVFYHGGLCAIPNTNLITNIGFGPDATHTVTGEDKPGIGTKSLGPLTHPKIIQKNSKADRYVFYHTFLGRSHNYKFQWLNLPRRTAKKIKANIKKWKLF